MSIQLDGMTISPTIFPDKTSQVWNVELPSNGHAEIVWYFESEGELMHLAQLCELLDQHQYTKVLHMPFLPYGRQDKMVSNDSTFALTTFARLINALNFNSVTTLDAHSCGFAEMVEGGASLFPHRQIHKALESCDPHLLAYPDRGAYIRYAKKLDWPAVLGDKVRDQATGYITSYALSGGDVAGKSILMVDDLCDGGMTFILLAAELYRAGAKEVSLYVSHGIFSKGLEPLREAGITKIYDKDGPIGVDLDASN